MKEDFHHLGSIKILPKGLDLDHNYETAERHYRHMSVTWEEYNAIRIKMPDVVYYIRDRKKYVLGGNEIPPVDADFPDIAIAGPDSKNRYTMIDLSTPGVPIVTMRFDNPVDAMHMMQMYNTRKPESKKYKRIKAIIESIAEDDGNQLYRLIDGIIAIEYRDCRELQKFYEIVSDINQQEKYNENSGVLYVRKLIDRLIELRNQYDGKLLEIIRKFVNISESVLEMIRVLKRFHDSDRKRKDEIQSYTSNIHRML